MANLLDGTQLRQLPNANSVEVSLVGPGFGECIVVHLPGGRWLVIDSCNGRESKNPVALDYLSLLGVDPGSAVKFVIASHWHDDHTKGIAKVFKACTQANFVCAAPLGYPEFVKLIGIYRRYLPPGGRGVDEMTEVIKVLEERRAKGELISPIFVLERSSLIDETTPHRIRLTALSPSSPACAVANAQIFNDLVPRNDGTRFKVPDLSPNDFAIVFALEVDDVKVLLGADLEENGLPGIGWQAVVGTFSCDRNGYQGFKVPHHGSENGNYDPVWTTMLEPSPWAILTPYSKGPTPLPKPTDVRRILGKTPNAFITATNTRREARGLDNAVQRMIREMGARVMDDPSGQGHIRLRKTVGSSDDWTVELFGEARRLS